MASPAAVKNMANTAKAAATPVREKAWLRKGMVLAATIAVGFTYVVIGPLSSLASYCIERIGNHFQANDEMDFRAKFHKDRVGHVLGMDAKNVKGKHLIKAAKILAKQGDPTLQTVVEEVYKMQSKENTEAAVTNAAVAFIGGPVLKEAVGGVRLAVGAAQGLKQTGKMMAATAGGGLLTSWTTKDHLSPQQMLEDMASQIAVAKEQGIDLKTVVTPQVIFLLRMAQDPEFAKEVANKYGKPFQKLDMDTQAKVMADFPALANAVTGEAYAVAKGFMPVQELGSSKPNLNSTAWSYRKLEGRGATSFVAAETARKAAAITNVGAGRLPAANSGSYIEMEDKRREAAANEAQFANIA